MRKIMIFAALCLCGCATVPDSAVQSAAPAAAAVVAQAETQPAAPAKPSSAAELAEQQQIQFALEEINKTKLNYKIQPGDLLEITVFQENDMNRVARISGDGAITFPLAGSVKVAGLSVPETERLLAEKLSTFLVNPQITLLIKEYSNTQIYVLGEVKRPGSIAIPAERGLTVLEAVTLAGGFTDIAAQDRTKIIRTTGGQNVSIEVQVSRITKQGDKSADRRLEPNDIVFVPQSFF